MISSKQNPRLKAVAELHKRAARVESGRCLIEGATEIAEAQRAGVLIETLFLAETQRNDDAAREVIDRATRQRPPCELISVADTAFEKLSSRESPDGQVAVAVTPQSRNFAMLKLPPKPLLLVLDGLEKPGNIGAILRTAEAAGVDAVLFSGESFDLYQPNLIRNSRGLVFRLPCVVAAPEALSSALQARRIRCVAASPDAPMSFWETRLDGAVAFVLGTEHEGLSRFWAKACHEAVRIPQQGAADSLNVSVTAALLVYEALRQRG